MNDENGTLTNVILRTVFAGQPLDPIFDYLLTFYYKKMDMSKKGIGA